MQKSGRECEERKDTKMHRGEEHRTSSQKVIVKTTSYMLVKSPTPILVAHNMHMYY